MNPQMASNLLKLNKAKTDLLKQKQKLEEDLSSQQNKIQTINDIKIQNTPEKR